MIKYITICPGCGNNQIFGRMGEWWCGNSECDVRWRNEDVEHEDNN